MSSNDKSVSSSSLKRAKLSEVASTKVIGTHSGTFQADEAMGVWMLRQLPEYRNSKVVRSRDKAVLEDLDIVIDVGGVYDHSKKRYDHHQRGYDERFEFSQTKVTKLSACGLVYRHYGKDVIRAYYPHLSTETLDWVYIQLYNTLLEALDAIDTGVEMVPSDITPLYKDTTGLAMRVSRYNPRWNEFMNGQQQDRPDPNERFEMASQICGDDFVAVLTKIVESDVPARDIVERAVLERKVSCHASGEIIAFLPQFGAGGGLPWKHHLYDLEKIHSIQPLIKFVLYNESPTGDGMWRVQAVTVEGKAFENRLGLPEEWRGVRDEDLINISNIPGSRFCHAAGFIGGNDTFQGALAMAVEALKRQ